jgi:hypothetical protein
MKKWNIILALFLVFSGLFFFFESEKIGGGVKTETIAPKLIPQSCAIIMVVCSVLLIGFSLFDKKHDTEKISVFTKKNILIPFTMVILFCYIMILEFIGFYISTGLFLFCLMMMYDKKWNIRDLGIKSAVSIGFPLIIYLIFYQLLNIYLPTGTLFY